MIKKVLGIGIGLLSFVGFTFGRFEYTSRQNIPVGGEGDLGFYVISSPDSAGNFNSIDTLNDLSKNIFFFKDRDTGDRNNTRVVAYYRTELGLGLYTNSYNNYGGLITNACVYDYTGYLGVMNNSQDCYYDSSKNKTWSEIMEMGISYGDITDIAYTTEQLTNRKVPMCLRSSTKNLAICFDCYQGNTLCQVDNQYSGSITIPAYGYADSLISFSEIPSEYLKSSPWSSGGGGSSSGTVVSPDSDVDTIINYYETRYNWNKSMCYVGTNDLTSPYGTAGISFDSGTGGTIFGLYHSLYSGYGTNIIQNVGSFINVGLINYYQWFYNRDNIQWIGQYNGPDQNVTYIYTGFTFPFANQPVAYYFMSSNLYDGYSNETTQGEEMALYCYSKLNRDYILSGDINYEQIKEGVTPGIIGRVEDYINYEINGNNSGAYQIPTSGDFWNSFGTGEYSEIGLDNTFNNFFTRITDIFKDFSPSHSTGIIPDYILYALIFLILFRVMKH